MNYRLTVTKKQAEIISRACELLTRVHLGQLNSVAWELMGIVKQSEDFISLREGLNKLEPLIHGYPNGGHPGIRSNKLCDTPRISWDIYQTVRQILAHQDGKEKSWRVDFDIPMKTSEEPLCQIEPTDDNPDPRPAGVKLADELKELIGTNDLAEAVRRVKTWKEECDGR